MKMPSARDIAQKFVRVTSTRASDYEAGVKNPVEDWEKETADSEDRFEAGIKAAITRKAFGKGVRKCGTAKQIKQTLLKGVPIWPERIVLSEDAMAEGMEPVVKTLEGVTLPQKYPKGDPRNIERVKVGNIALHRMKTGS